MTPNNRGHRGPPFASTAQTRRHGLVSEKRHKGGPDDTPATWCGSKFGRSLPLARYALLTPNTSLSVSLLPASSCRSSPAHEKGEWKARATGREKRRGNKINNKLDRKERGIYSTTLGHHTFLDRSDHLWVSFHWTNTVFTSPVNK